MLSQPGVGRFADEPLVLNSNGHCPLTVLAHLGKTGVVSESTGNCRLRQSEDGTVRNGCDRGIAQTDACADLSG